MKNLSLFCLALATSLAASFTHADWIEKSDLNATYVLNAQAKYDPESASASGVLEFDGQVQDLNANIYDRQAQQRAQLLAELNKRLAVEQHPKIRQDLDILIQSVADEDEAAAVYHNNLIPFYNVHKHLFSGFNSLLDPRNEKSRYPQALARLSKYNGREPGFKPFTELAIARTEERFDVAGLVGPYKGELETEIANTDQYIEGIRSVFERAELTGWEEDFELLKQQLGDYKEWLQGVLSTKARPDNQLPAVVYANNLQNYGVRSTPEELIAEATYSYQFIRSEMKALAWKIAEDRGWKDKSLVPVIRALKKEQIPQDKILEVYQQRLAAIEEIIVREDIITMPKRAANIRLATDAESAAVPASFMSPPQLINNTGQYGEFVLVQSNPAAQDDAVMDDWSHDAITWALTIHEARPGHELQFTSLVENGTSLARALFAFNSANAEGWGLYSESIMHEFLPPEAQLFNLYTRLMRAARMFMDPMVNTGRMTHAEAMEFMTGQMALSPAMARSEADRYASWAPGQATSYYYGYISLMRLRTEVEIALGDKFNQREFHDFILEQGLLPPELLREAVRGEFVR